MIDSGIYALLIIADDCTMQIGSLGHIQFKRGYYLYVGSAQKNMGSRIARHRRTNKKFRWHIDYFLKCGRIVDVFTTSLPKKCEEWISIQLSRSFDYVPKFGASDSHAPSHLFYGAKEDLSNELITLFERCRK